VGGLFVAAKGHDPHVSCGYLRALSKFTSILPITHVLQFHMLLGQEEIRSAKAAVHKLGASMLNLCNGTLSSFALCI
jgi:hypothetical protein